MNGMFLPKMKFVTYQVQELYSKGLREGYKNDSMLLNAKMLYEQLKPFLLKICANFYENSSPNKKVTRFDSKLAFLRKFLY